MGTKKLNLTIQLKRGTTEEWEQYGSIVPAVGEPCLDLTTGRLRFGDGNTAYRDLPDTMAIIDSNISTLLDNDDEFHENINRLFELIGDENSGLSKDISDLQLYVGQIPSESSAADIVEYISDSQSTLYDDLITYIDDSQPESLPNIDVLENISQEDVERWTRAQPNVIESIRVNGAAVPMSGKVANITVAQGGGDSYLPEVTVEDNGKFLRVIDGVWEADELIDVSEEGM